MLKLLYLAELVDINIKYIASNTSLMMSLSVGYPQILASGYLDNKFTIRFSPRYMHTHTKIVYNMQHNVSHICIKYVCTMLDAYMHTSMHA